MIILSHVTLILKRLICRRFGVKKRNVESLKNLII